MAACLLYQITTTSNMTSENSVESISCTQYNLCSAKEQLLEEDLKFNTNVHAGSAVGFIAGLGVALVAKNPRIRFIAGSVPCFSVIPFYYSWAGAARIHNELASCRQSKIGWYIRCQDDQKAANIAKMFDNMRDSKI